MICFLFYFQWIIGMLFTIILVIAFFYVKREEEKAKKTQMNYLAKLSYKVENAGKNIFFHLPIGIIIYDDNFEIEWTNPYISSISDQSSLRKKSLGVFSDELIKHIEAEKEEIWLEINHLQFKTK